MAVTDYGGFSYQPDYGYEIYQDDKLLKSSEKVKYAACFAEVFNYFNAKTKDIFKGIYTLRCRKKFVKRSGNYCPLNKKEILKLVRYMREKLDVKVSFQEDKQNYIFIITVEGKPIKHKFALTFARVFFEFPYSEMAKETLRLRDVGIIDGVNFTHQNFLKVFHMVHMTYKGDWGYGHSLFVDPCRKITTRTMRQAFEEGRARVQQVYVGSERALFYKKFNKLRLEYHGEDWESKFEKKLTKYSDNFKLMTNVKKGIRRRAHKVVRKVD